jgi:hypothetical protein
MKCSECNSRKAKRICPAKDGLICAQCCGEKRVLELDCPESCSYLIAGRERESAEFGKLLRTRSPQQQEKSRRVLTENQDVIAHLEYTIAQYRLHSRDFSDEDVSKAVEMLLDVYRTEDKGILYEKDSEDLKVESIRRELREVLESYRNPEGGESEGIVAARRSRLLLRDAVECLELVQFMIQAYSGNRGSGTGYVDFLARMTPRGEAKSSIIMP